MTLTRISNVAERVENEDSGDAQDESSGEDAGGAKSGGSIAKKAKKGSQGTTYSL